MLGEKADVVSIEEEKGESNHVLKQECTHTEPPNMHIEKTALGGEECRGGQKQSFRRRRVYFKGIKAIAVDKFVNKHQGITFRDILKLVDDPSYTPKQAKDVLRNLKRKGRLFTYTRTIPQQYYLTRANAVYAAQKVEYSITSSTHANPTGGKAFQTDKYSTITTSKWNFAANIELAGSELLAYVQANSLYNCLLLFNAAGLCIHNIHINFFLLTEHATPAESYELLDSPGVTTNPHDNDAKILLRNVGENRRVRFKLYRSGKAEVYVSCSKAPFPIVTDHDVTALMGFMHQVHYILSLHLSDSTNSRYVPPVASWRLSEADISKDVPTDAMSMHIQPKLELKMFDTTLRLYVKLIGGESFLRLEEMRRFNERFFLAVASLRYGVVM